jgi:hypothetical protein
MLKEKFADIRQDWSAKALCKEKILISLKHLHHLQSFQSIRCFIAITAYYGLNLEQINVVTASFFNPDVEEENCIQVRPRS